MYRYSNVLIKSVREMSYCSNRKYASRAKGPQFIPRPADRSSIITTHNLVRPFQHATIYLILVFRSSKPLDALYMHESACRMT
jgi:hypothetical protein